MKIKKTPSKGLAINEATKILDKYYITNPRDLPFSAILGSENVWYQERKLAGCLGNMIRHRRHGIITVSKDITYLPQKRFVIAHEFGHWVLHKDVPNFNCDDKMLHQWHGGGSKYEIEANVFASELLMPNALFTSRCQGRSFSCELIQELAEHFTTSLTATAFRFTDIGNESLMVVYSHNNFAKWHKPSSDFEFDFYERKFSIPKGTLTSSYYEGKIETIEEDVTIAKKWFINDWAIKDGQYLNEAIIPLPSMNSCITFLWQHEDNFEEF